MKNRDWDWFQKDSEGWIQPAELKTGDEVYYYNNLSRFLCPCRVVGVHGTTLDVVVYSPRVEGTIDFGDAERLFRRTGAAAFPQEDE